MENRERWLRGLAKKEHNKFSTRLIIIAALFGIYCGSGPFIFLSILKMPWIYLIGSIIACMVSWIIIAPINKRINKLMEASIDGKLKEYFQSESPQDKISKDEYSDGVENRIRKQLQLGKYSEERPNENSDIE